MPNFHKFTWEKQVKTLHSDQRYPTSCRRLPGSPRNRIIQACGYRLDSFDIVSSCLRNIKGEKIAVVYQPTKRKRACTVKDGVHVGHPQYNKNKEIEVRAVLFCYLVSLAD